MKRAIRFLPIILILSVFSVWMLAAGATSRASIDAEFATAEELVANGDGVQITVESAGSEVFRGGRRAFPKTCYTFEYTASGVTTEFAEKRLCAPHWRQPVTVELIYERDSPGSHYWVRSAVTEQMLRAPQETTRLGAVIGVAALAMSGITVAVWLVGRRKDETPLTTE